MADGVFEGGNYGLSTSFTIDFNALGAKDVQQKVEGVIARLRAVNADARRVEAALRGLSSAWGEVKGRTERDSMAGAAGFYSAFSRNKNFLGSDVVRRLEDKVQTMLGTRLNNIGTDDGDGGGGGGGASALLRIRRLALGFGMLVRSMNAFVESSARVNRELFLLAVNAQTSVSEIAKIGGAMEAYGGTKGEAANFMRSYELEMSKMSVGEGIGGKFLEASRKFGLKFIPNDFKAQERAIVEYLSSPNTSQRQRLGLAAELGLSSEQVSRYSRGLAEFDRENALQESYTKNADAAAKASDKYQRATQHLEAQIQDIKNGALVPILDILTPIKQFMADHPVVAASYALGKEMFDLGTKIVQVVAWMRMAGIGGGMAKGIAGALKDIFASSGSTKAPSPGGPPGGSGSSMSAAVLGASAIAGALTGSMQVAIGADTYKETAETHNILYDYVKSRQVAMAMWVKDYAREQGDSELVDRVQDFASKQKKGLRRDNSFELIQFTIFDDIKQSVVAIDRNVELMVSRMGKNGSGKSDVGHGITIERIDINVESEATDPEEVAEAVQERLMLEMRNVIQSIDPGGEA